MLCQVCLCIWYCCFTMMTLNNAFILPVYNSTLQMGHNMNPNVILGPSQRFSRTRRVHWRWNTWVQSNCKRKKKSKIQNWNNPTSIAPIWRTNAHEFRGVESHLNCRSSREGLCEADHAHVICILFQTASVLVTAVQTWEAGLLVLHSSTGVSARMSFTAS